jgi:outer membrane immunogenic protein
MRILLGYCMLCLALAGTAAMGVADAHDTAPWDGGYIGFNAGDSSSNACNIWAFDGRMRNSINASQVGSGDCSRARAFVGGLQIGENFQYERFVWGVGVDLDYWNSKPRNDSFNYVGPTVPSGKYSFSAGDAPSAFAIVGPRIGYAANPWMAYLRIGGMLSAGAHHSELSYTPTGATRPTASFGGSADFSTFGWVAGGGAELGLYGAWSVTLEYLHANLGKGSDSSGACNGPAAVCSAFLGVSLGTAHEGFSANIFRVGITYWLNFWDP